MTNTYRAKVGFSCPADPASLANRIASLAGKKAGKVEWMTAKKGDKVTPLDKAMLKDWLDRGLVEEVKS